MKSTIWTRFAAYACVAVIATACGKKDKDDDKDPAPAKVEQPSIVGTESQGGQTRITFSSATKDAKLKCLIQAEGQTASDAWVDCLPEGWVVDTQTGVRYTVKVKALSADGKRESDIREFSFTAVSDDAGQQINLAAVILNKADVPATYTKTSLKLNLGVDGPAIDSEDVRFECKREYQQEFGRCGDDASYDFGQLIDGSMYSLTVRAVHIPSKTTSTEDNLSFTVQLAQLTVNGRTDLETKKTGTISLTYDAAQIQGLTVSCSLDGAAAQDCSSGLSLNLSQLQAGSHSMKFEAKDADQTVIAQTTINFCARQCSQQDSGSGSGGPNNGGPNNGGPNGGGPNNGGQIGGVPPMVQQFQIGSFYKYVVEPGMHVTEYATTKTYNGQLAFYRIMAESDPFYLGNYGCFRDWDRRISAATPAGDQFDYCLTTPPNSDMYKWLTDYRLANNHLEVATDPDQVVHNPNLIPGLGLPNHERITINVFDQDYEYMQGRSQFERLCMNRRGTITKTPPIRFLDRGFWDNLNVRAEFYMCTESIVGPGFGGLPSGGDKWWIGAFFITSDGLNLPQYECFTHNYTQNYGPEFCGQFKNPSLLEVTFMTKTPWMDPMDFARDAQMKFLRNLQELTPGRH